MHWPLSALGAAAVLGSIALRFTAAAAGSDPEKGGVERVLAWLSLLGVVALALMFATTETGERVFKIAALASDTRTKFEGAATVLFIVLLCIASVPIFFAERALFPMRRAERIEARRVSAAIARRAHARARGRSTARSSPTRRASSTPRSTFRTSAPRARANRRATSSPRLGEPVKVQAFFPQLNEVGTRGAKATCGSSRRPRPNFKCEMHDRLLVPAVAKEAKVTQDGVIVLARGALARDAERRRRHDSRAAQAEDARRRLPEVAAQGAARAEDAYLTVGHGELNEASGAEASEGRSATGVKKLLEIAELRGQGPRPHAGPGQRRSRRRHRGRRARPGAGAPARARSRPSSSYAEKGGHLLLALDPDAKVDLDPLADIAGLTWVTPSSPTTRRTCGGGSTTPTAPSW